MTAHCNRWLLTFAAGYLALLPTNTLTFARSVAFAGAIALALCVLARSRTGRAPAIPAPGWSIGAPLAVWALWSLASLAWSIDPRYSERELEREVSDSVVAMLVFYVAGASERRSLRTLCAAAIGSFAILAVLAIAMVVATGGEWDAGRWHHGVGPWSTFTVLLMPLLFGLIAPPPAGFGSSGRSLTVGLVLIALVVITDRMTDNRIVWVALAGTLAVACTVAALRWPRSLVRRPLRWTAPAAVLLLVLGVAFVDAVQERAAEAPAPDAGVLQNLEHDPRIELWERLRERIEQRPWLGYGFGRRVLAGSLAGELGNPLLAHAHNTFASQWLQTGIVGMLAFAAVLCALAMRYARFVRSRDDTLAFVGVIGLAVLAGFVLKNLTDDFLFRSNARELWVLCAMLLGYGMQREQAIARPGAAQAGAGYGATPERKDEAARAGHAEEAHVR